VSDLAFRAAVVAVAIAAAGAVVRLSVCNTVELPPVPPRPSPKRVEVARVTADVNSDPAVYAEQLARDSRLLQLAPPVTPAGLSRVFPARSETEPFVLEVRGKGSSAEVLGLRLALAVSAIEGTPRRQMVLTISNTTDHHLAYRVVTRPSRGTSPCHEKSDFAHNAVVLAPGEKVQRSECIYKSGWRLLVNRVDTIELPPLAYHYLGSVPPPALALDLLPARGHRPGAGRPICQIFHSASLGESIRGGETTWRDLVDFYGRHSCQTYTFPVGYKAFETDGARSLPALRATP
jgi:hypothetical protein